MKAHVAVVGAGAIGRRHIEAILKLEVPFRLSIVEPVDDAAGKAKALVGGSPPGAVEASFHAGLRGILGDVDVAVVATTARDRAEAVRGLLEGRSVRYLVLEKVLFQREREYGEIGELLDRRRTPAWVNCPRRMYPGYQELRRGLAGERALHVSAEGGEWGLACNLIHMIDLLSYLAGGVDPQVDASGLDEALYPSKRGGFMEVCGSVRVFDPGGADLTVHAHAGSAAGLCIRAIGRSVDATVDEGHRVARIRSPGSDTEAPFAVPYQSELTHHVVRALLADGSCLLTPYAESARLHLPFLRAISAHVRKVTGEPLDACPIT